ncbi:MAG: CotH kinase family protein [Chitinophagales bacterium]
MHKISPLILLLIMKLSLVSAQNIDHWETAIFDDDNWKYLTPNFEPNSNWRKINFDDSSWNTGQGGIGYGDGDDNTTISSTVSLYLRKTFNITDTSKLSMAVLNMDYDDAFVAYLNNVEIARANVGAIGDHPTYNQTSNGLHEAQMYQGGNPSQFIIDVTTFKNNILPGNNVLSIQVHNESAFSSDLTARAFLSFGIVDSSAYYFPNPSWFSILVFNSSNLPIVNINTNGQNIPDNNRIVADMGIIYNGVALRNYITDPFNEYNGKISIERRGSSSQNFPKKSFSLETQDVLGENNNVSLIDLPVENDWVLYAPYSDKTLIRNVLTYSLGNSLDRYAPRTQLCEVMINNEYQGVYVLTEKIKRDNDRVDIAKLTVNDTIGDDLTGGYILKIDKTTNGTGYNWDSPILPPFVSNEVINYKLHYPKENQELPVQAAYIQNYVTTFENALNGVNYLDTLTGYRNYIDVSSFIDFFIMNEVSKNVDGFRLSTYMYKDKDSKGGKLTLGPLWDFNLAFGNADYCQGGSSAGWGSDFNTYCADQYVIPFWWNKLMTDTTYTNELKCRWDSLRVHQFHTDSIFENIDDLTLNLDESQQRNFSKWPVLDTYVWPNNYVGSSYANEMSYLKTWIGERMIWLDDNMPGNCIYVAPEPEDTFYIEPIDSNLVDIDINFTPIDSFIVSFPIDSAVSIQDLVNGFEVNIYPNPTENLINLVFQDPSIYERTISLIDFKGVLIHKYSSRDKEVAIDLSAYSEGVYLLSIVEGSVCVKRKIVKL